MYGFTLKTSKKRSEMARFKALLLLVKNRLFNVQSLGMGVLLSGKSVR